MSINKIESALSGVLTTISTILATNSLYKGDTVMPAKTPRLEPNEKLLPGQFLVSPNGKFRLQVQIPDGNLVVVKLPDTPIWSTNTPRGVTKINNEFVEPHLIMQGDGNLIFQDGIAILGESEAETLLFKTNTQHNDGSHLEMQDDGNLVIRHADGGKVWASFDHPSF